MVACLVAFAGLAPASATPVGYNYTAPGGGWYAYGQTHSGTNISFKPNNLFANGSGGGNLSLRLYDVDNALVLSATRTWTDFSHKSIMTGLNSSYRWKVQASGYNYNGDTSWGGTLYL